MPTQVQYSELFDRLMQNVKSGKLDLGSSSGGDACCAQDMSPEEVVKQYLPKLNEIIFQILEEELQGKFEKTNYQQIVYRIC